MICRWFTTVAPGLCLLWPLAAHAQKASPDKQSSSPANHVVVKSPAPKANTKPTSKAVATEGNAEKPQKSFAPAKSTPAASVRNNNSKAQAKESSRSNSSKAEKDPPPRKDTAPKVPSSPATAARTFKGDIYGLASLIQERWNFVELLPSAEELAAGRLNALRRRAARLANAFDALSRTAERRSTNVRNGAGAVYLLHVARGARPCYLAGAADVAAAQIAVLRTTFRDDANSADELIQASSPLRETLNRASEELSFAEAGKAAPANEELNWNPAGFPEPSTVEVERSRYSVTQTQSDLARERTISILAARVPPVEALKAVLEAEGVAREHDQRQSFASFAPAPPRAGPQYSPLIDPGTPMPADVGSRRSKPDPPPNVNRPQERGVVLPAEAGAAVVAAANGTVAFAGQVRGYGNTLILQHESQLFSVYAYLSGFEAAEGDTVEAGQMIGHAGTIPGSRTSGVRFEVRRGRTSSPLAELIGTDDPAARVLQP
ncbi:MAG: peptidoglycan DD-metalloendopeptidase family protein [Candidatus Sumerlaeaceae bacterium]